LNAVGGHVLTDLLAISKISIGFELKDYDQHQQYMCFLEVLSFLFSALPPTRVTLST
jgi:hypothetical protein